MIRFFIALWASKLTLFYFNLRGKKNDWPGVVAYRLCPNFLSLIKKPKEVYCVTGTDGKTTTATLIANMLKSQGKKVSFNPQGANLKAGHILLLIKGVNIFNKSKIDAAVLEADELTLADTMGAVKPSHVIVVNIAKDSLKRNAHPEYIYDRINALFTKLGKDVVAVLNGNDPISSRLASNSNRVYFAMNDLGIKPYSNFSKDIGYCPICGGKIIYDYRLYRHLGGYRCDSCDFKNPTPKYFAEFCDFEKREMVVLENNERTTYPLISDTVFNAFNVLSVITLFRELNFSKESIIEFLKTQTVPKTRENCLEYNGVKYYSYGCKAQNISAASTVFENLSKDGIKKDLVLFMDETQDRFHPLETASWIYETDFQFLNSECINKIIIIGHLRYYYEHKLLLSGFPKEKIVAVEMPDEVPSVVSKEGIKACYVLFEVDFVDKAREIRDSIIKYMKEENND